jgi:hypothetical protein
MGTAAGVGVVENLHYFGSFHGGLDSRPAGCRSNFFSLVIEHLQIQDADHSFFAAGWETGAVGRLMPAFSAVGLAAGVTNGTIETVLAASPAI